MRPPGRLPDSRVRRPGHPGQGRAIRSCRGRGAGHGQAGPPGHPADRRGVHEEDQGVHNRDLLPVACHRLHARVQNRPDAEGDPRRHRRRAGQAALFEGGARLHAPPRQVHAAGEGLHHRDDRGRPRDDRRRRRVGSADGEARSEQGGPRQAGGPAYHQDGRRGGRCDRAARCAGLLRQRGCPRQRGRGADSADGAGLPPGGGRQPLHPEHPREHHHAHHAGRRAGRPRLHGGRVRVEEEAPERHAGERGLFREVRGARQQPRRDGPDARDVAGGAQHLHRVEGAGAARPPRIGLVPLRQHRGQRPLQRVARPDPHQRVAPDRVEQRERDDADGDARRLRVGHVRHLVARLPDVLRRAAQRHQPPLRDVRQRRQRRHRGSDAVGRRDVADVVPAEPADQPRDVVAQEQQQLRADGHHRLAQLLRQQPHLLPPQLLRQEQALRDEAEGGRAGGVRAAGERPAPRHAGRAAARPAAAGRGDLEGDRGVHCHDSGPAGGGRGRARRARRAEGRRGGYDGGSAFAWGSGGTGNFAPGFGETGGRRAGGRRREARAGHA